MIIRRRHTANFTTIGNVLFNDERLRADEMGVLAFLLSRPHDWEVRRPQLAKRFDIGRESIKRIMHNCMCAGWIIARKTRLSNGSFHTIYEVRDEPGPMLSPEQVKDALSLVSSEATDAAEEGEDDRVGDHPPDSGPPGTGQPDTASQIRQTRRGSSKEELLNTDSINPESPKGGCSFSDVKEAWPPDHVLSYAVCEGLHLGLTDAVKEAAFRGLKPYLDECAEKNRKVCDLATYYREARWERFANKAPPVTRAIFKVRTPQWFRWREYRIATGQNIKWMETYADSHPDGVWSEPSEWPPAMPKGDAENVA